MTVDYAYLSNPPILADLGQIFFLLDDLFLQFNMTFTFDNEILGVKVNGLDYSLDELTLFLDGLSDTSVLVSNTIEDLKIFIGSRLANLLKLRREFLQKKLDPLINKFL